MIGLSSGPLRPTPHGAPAGAQSLEGFRDPKAGVMCFIKLIDLENMNSRIMTFAHHG